MSEIDDEIEWRSCEHCSRRVDVETLRCMGDVYFCPLCADEWTAFFEACQHPWDATPMQDDFGDTGRYCPRCTVFVSDDNAMTMFPLVCDGWPLTL